MALSETAALAHSCDCFTPGISRSSRGYVPAKGFQTLFTAPFGGRGGSQTRLSAHSRALRPRGVHCAEVNGSSQPLAGVGPSTEDMTLHCISFTQPVLITPVHFKHFIHNS